MSGHILVVGSINMDLVVRTPKHPEIGETVIGYDFKTFPGGKGANQAVATARLGYPTKMIGRIGTDEFGNKLLRTVTGAGVDTSTIIRDEEEPTGVAFITVDSAGQNTIVVASGANMHLTPKDINRAATAFKDADIVLIQLEIPLETVKAAIEFARWSNARVVLNPAPAQLLDADLLSQVDYLIPNQTELGLLTGQDRLDAAVKVLQGRGVMNLVVTLGAQGAFVSTASDQKLIPTYQVKVVDTTAAGDAFAGGFAAALYNGKDVFEAAMWGNAAGALATTTAGAQPSLPDRNKFERFLKENNLPVSNEA